MRQGDLCWQTKRQVVRDEYKKMSDIAKAGGDLCWRCIYDFIGKY